MNRPGMSPSPVQKMSEIAPRSYRRGLVPASVGEAHFGVD